MIRALYLFVSVLGIPIQVVTRIAFETATQSSTAGAVRTYFDLTLFKVWFKTIFSGTGVGGWVGEGKKFFFYLCHKFCCCCSGVCVACSSRSTWKSFAFGNSLWEELRLGTHFSPLTHHLEILTTISFEMGTRNQCDQMVRLFLNIWSFATMKIRAKK